MIHSIVQFQFGDFNFLAILHDEGWVCPGLPAVTDALAREAFPGRLGPAGGESYARATYDAADLLSGDIVFRVDVAIPPGEVY